MAASACSLPLVISLFILSFGSFVLGQTCEGPHVTSRSYTTTDATVVASIAFVAEFSVQCSNNLKNLNLHADVNGKIIPVTKSQNENKFQVSWTEDPIKVSSGDYQVKVYDEEGFAVLRKAQRNGEDIANLPPLFTLSVNHHGTYNGPWIQGELMATMVAVFVWFLAYTAKSKLQS